MTAFKLAAECQVFSCFDRWRWTSRTRMIECAPHRILCPCFPLFNPVLPLPLFLVILFAYRRRYGDEGKTGRNPVHVACAGEVWGLAVV